jgi:hypothetical protein
MLFFLGSSQGLPVSIEKLLKNLRISEISQPADFWAQYEEEREPVTSELFQSKGNIMPSNSNEISHSEQADPSQQSTRRKMGAKSATSKQKQLNQVKLGVPKRLLSTNGSLKISTSSRKMNSNRAKQSQQSQQ